MVLSPGAINYDGAALSPGDVICLETGTYDRLTFRNCVGVDGNPIIITNEDDLVTMDHATNENYLIDCEYVRLTGSNNPALNYGIKYRRRLLAQEGDTNIEFDYLEFDGDGLRIKNDDDITMTDIHVHNCYFYDISYEALYIGQAKAYDGSNTLQQVHIFDNIFENIDEGIDVKQCDEDLFIYDNFIKDVNPTYPVQQTQGGISVNEGCASTIYRNQIFDSEGCGIFISESNFDHEIYNNLIHNVGHTPGAALVADAIHAGSPNTVNIYNNTIVSAGDGSDGWGIWFPNTSSTGYVYNCVILNCTDGSIRAGGNPGGNFHHNDTQEEGYTPANYGFVDHAGDDFHLTGGCDGVNAGTDTGAPSDDLDKKARPVVVTDIGCYEYGAAPPTGSALSDSHDAYIEEVEFVSPDGLILKPAGFEDVQILKEQRGW